MVHDGNDDNEDGKDEDEARFSLAELTDRVEGPSTRLVEARARQHGPC